MKERPKYLAAPGKIWKSFTILLPSLWINHIFPNGNLDNNVQTSEQKYAKTEMVGELDAYESFQNDIVVNLKYSIKQQSNRTDSH